MINHPSYRSDDDEEVEFDSSPAVSGHIVELEWRFTPEEITDIERREAARKRLGGFGFHA